MPEFALEEAQDRGPSPAPVAEVMFSVTKQCQQGAWQAGGTLVLDQLLVSAPALSHSSVTPCGPYLLRNLCSSRLRSTWARLRLSTVSCPTSPSSCGLHKNGLLGELVKNECLSCHCAPPPISCIGAGECSEACIFNRLPRPFLYRWTLQESGSGLTSWPAKARIEPFPC